MKFHSKVFYTPHDFLDNAQFLHRYKNVNKSYDKLMKRVAKAIKEDKQIIFSYADNCVTVEIND